MEKRLSVLTNWAYCVISRTCWVRGLVVHHLFASLMFFRKRRTAADATFDERVNICDEYHMGQTCGMSFRDRRKCPKAFVSKEGFRAGSGGKGGKRRESEEKRATSHGSFISPQIFT